MDSVRSGPFGQIFRPDNFIFGQVHPTLAALSSPAEPALCCKRQRCSLQY